MSQPQAVAVTDLELPQLAEVKKHIEEELTHLTNSYAQLKSAQAKFKACLENVGEIKPVNKDKVILVPLTSSLYVPGKLNDTENVIVDVGTGYFIQKTRAQATKYYTQKVDFVKSNLDALQEAMQKKQDNLNVVVNVMQGKLAAQSQSQK